VRVTGKQFAFTAQARMIRSDQERLFQIRIKHARQDRARRANKETKGRKRKGKGEKVNGRAKKEKKRRKRKRKGEKVNERAKKETKERPKKEMRTDRNGRHGEKKTSTESKATVSGTGHKIYIIKNEIFIHFIPKNIKACCDSKSVP
jgi:hypothetical protein